MKKITAEFLLSKLPPNLNQWRTIKEKQDVDDIIEEVLNAHERYAALYDKIALYFDRNTIDAVCNALKRFCIENFLYVEEPTEDQTTAVPQGLLTKKGRNKLTDGIDCKGFATFCGGILDGLNRMGNSIDWCYRFASYNALNKVPHHVFVVVFDGDEEIWIDGTPKADENIPIWIQDEKISIPSMALRTQIASASPSSIGIAVKPVANIDQLNFDGTHKYKDAFAPSYLGLSAYADYENSSGTNFTELANQLNALISKGPEPGHTVDANFVKWIFDNSIRSWNFYFMDGVEPGYDGDDLLPANYPRPVITDDGRLTISHDAKLDDYRNGEIHILTAWMQALINEHDETPYPITPRNLKLFSQENTGNPNNPNANLFNERRGASVFQEIGKALEKYVNVIKQGVLKIIGSIPRNAFLALVGLNIFKMATNLQESIDEGHWDEMAKKWKNVGGNPDKLKNTIEHGAKKAEGNPDELPATVGAAPAAAAWMAAAGPILAIFLKFLNKDGKLNGVIPAIQEGLQIAFPDGDFSILNDGTIIDRNNGNQPVQWYVDDKDDENKGGGNNDLPGENKLLTLAKDNPEITAAIVGLGTFFLTNMKKKGKNKNFIPAIAFMGITYVLLKWVFVDSGPSKRDQLINWINVLPESQINNEDREHFLDVFKRMSASEINTMYEWIFNYIKPQKQLPTSGPLYDKLVVIDRKYSVFGT